ncbi:MAG: AfsR/SARP family transcriptional regulator [Acidimicrobiales bacterium]
MPDDLERQTIPLSKNPRAPSMLATAALLSARRRWSGPVLGEGEDRGQIIDRVLDDPDDTSRGPARQRPRFVMPAVHLEDPEWSRAVLGLLSRNDPTRFPASALVLMAEQIEVDFPGVVRSAPPPFETASSTSWILARRSGTLAELPSTPTIVAASRQAGLVGAWNLPGSRCLLDLVGCGSVALDGPPVAVGATLSDVVVELATRRWCDLDELIVVGFGSEVLGLEGVHCLPNIDAAKAYLLAPEREAEPRRMARCLVVAPPIGRRSPTNLNPLRSLVELVHASRGTGLVCCDPSLVSVQCIWRLSAHGQTVDLSFRRRGRPTVTLEPPATQTVVRPARVTADPPDRSGDYREHDGLPSGEGSDLPAGLETSDRPGPEECSSGESVEPLFLNGAPAVTIRILGPVEVVGTTTSLDRRPRVTELVVYLGLHPDGCSGEAISNAVWPDRRVPSQTVANRLSEARQALGDTHCGSPRLRRVSGRHVLSPDVRTDWDEFERLTGQASQPADWARALGLIRGRPFEGISECGWALLEGYLARIEGRVVDVSCRLASRQLDEGDATSAEQALRKGLLASPWDERLYRMLMVVNHACGNRGGVEAALRSLAHVLEWHGDPIDGVHPETAQLYRQLVAERDVG